MADDRSITGSAATEDDVHDDDELAEVLAAELERYATGAVPVLPRPSAAQPAGQAVPAPAEPPMQPLSVPRIEQRADDQGDRTAAPQRTGSAFARRAAEVERAMRQASPAAPPTAPQPTVPAEDSADS